MNTQNKRVLFTPAQIDTAEENNIAITSDGYGFDYKNQAWIKDGLYVRCGHLNDCTCYGTIHEGRPIEL